MDNRLSGYAALVAQLEHKKAQLKGQQEKLLTGESVDEWFDFVLEQVKVCFDVPNTAEVGTDTTEDYALARGFVSIGSLSQVGINKGISGSIRSGTLSSPAPNVGRVGQEVDTSEYRKLVQQIDDQVLKVDDQKVDDLKVDVLKVDVQKLIQQIEDRLSKKQRKDDELSEHQTTTTKPRTLNSLPDECLLLLLEKWPLKVQLTLRTVCTRWNFLIERRVWHKVSSIGLRFVTGSKCVRFNRNHYFKAGNSSLERFVTRERFPRVTSFSFTRLFDDRTPNGHNFLSHYLTQWSNSLTQLSLCLTPLKPLRLQTELWKQIDSIRSLKSLYLDFSSETTNSWTIPKTLSILANLDTFELCDYRDSINKKQTILTNQFGPNLRHLKLACKTVELMEMWVKSIVSARLNFALCELEIEFISVKLSKPITTGTDGVKPILLDILKSFTNLSSLHTLRVRSIPWEQFISLKGPLISYPKSCSIHHLTISVVHSLAIPRVAASDSEPSNYVQVTHLDTFDDCFFTFGPVMFPSLETIQLSLFDESPNQHFVDMVNGKLKLKFAVLRSGQLAII